MSKFGVTIEVIEEIREHGNADRLEIVKLAGMGYQMIVGKGLHTVGDKVVYFPLDARIPNSVLERMGMVGKLSGKEHDVVKTVRLMGKISQGLVVEYASLFTDEPPDFYAVGEATIQVHSTHLVGTDLTELLGVTKYEPQSVLTKSANLHRLPDHVQKYDIENAERYEEIVKLLLDVPVFISEKVEGSHWACSLDCATGKVSVYQRNKEIVPIEGKGTHTWWKAFIDGVFGWKLSTMSKLSDKTDGYITIRGEIVGPGIQKNYYKLDAHRVLAFEIEIDGEPVSADLFLKVCGACEINTVPIIWTGDSLRSWLYSMSEYGETLPEISNGKSFINTDKRREGLVIKPMTEMHEDGFGRVFIKQKSPEYLAKAK